MPTLTDQKVQWSSPSNIALVKYWGKYGEQLPRNPSISFTLSACHTDTSMSIRPGNTEVAFFFEDKENQAFGQKIQSFLKRCSQEFKWVNDYDFEIYSSNTFPHSAGIASSASAMSAVVMCLLDLHEQYFGQFGTDVEKLQMASHLARLGSGSASRSLFPKAALWGRLPGLEKSSSLHASPLASYLHEDFQDFQDSILIIHDGVKAVSSSAGHKLMEAHRFAGQRFQQATEHCEKLLDILPSGDIEQLIKIVESEALTLHALMMMSQPPYILMKPNTLVAIDRLQAYRRESKVPVCFTLDAGPNLHILYRKKDKTAVRDFIENQLLDLCVNGHVIHDEMGLGPQKIV